MPGSSRKCACRRELNSYEGASRERTCARSGLREHALVGALTPEGMNRSLFLIASRGKRGTRLGQRFAGTNRATCEVRRQSVHRSAAARSTATSARSIGGGLKAWLSTAASAEREATVVLVHSASSLRRPPSHHRAAGRSAA